MTQILPQTMQLLPNPLLDVNGRPIFTDKHLEQYDVTMPIMLEIQSLFMEEAESVLQISQRIVDLNAAMVQNFLKYNNPHGARTWLKTHLVHDPMLALTIDRFEIEKATSSTVPLFPINVSGRPKLQPVFQPSTASWNAIHALHGGNSIPINSTSPMMPSFPKSIVPPQYRT